MNNQKRPIWVWLISSFYFFSAIFTLASFYLVVSHIVTITPDAQQYLDSLTLSDHIFKIIIGSAIISGAAALFLLKRVSFYLFLIGLLFNIGLTLRHALFKGWLQVVGQSGLLSLFISWGLLLSVCIYTWHLSKKGTLK